MDSETFVATSRHQIHEFAKHLKSLVVDEDEPREVLKVISAYSANASHMALNAAKSSNPKVTNFYNDELSVFLKELDFQFRIWSRIEAVITREWEMTK